MFKIQKLKFEKANRLWQNWNHNSLGNCYFDFFNFCHCHCRNFQIFNQSEWNWNFTEVPEWITLQVLSSGIELVLPAMNRPDCKMLGRDKSSSIFCCSVNDIFKHFHQVAKHKECDMKAELILNDAYSATDKVDFLTLLCEHIQARLSCIDTHAPTCFKPNQVTFHNLNLSKVQVA